MGMLNARKQSKTGLTGSGKKKALKVIDADACELRTRLRVVQNDLYEVRVIAARNRHKWPYMESQLRRASLYVLAQLMTAEVACDPFDDDDIV